MNLHKVRGNGAILYYPEQFPRDSAYRGGQGYVVDLDAPGEALFCAGQMQKLEPAPEAKAATPITHPVALRLMREEAKRVAEAEAAAKEQADAQEQSETEKSDETEPLEVVRGGEKRKKAS